MSKPETWKSWEGRVIEGKYPLRQWLGASDHSAVFLSESADLPSQKIAIKLIPVEAAKAEFYLSPIRTTQKLSHPHLIRTFECGLSRVENSTLVYVLMECADDDLSQILPDRALEPNEVSDLLPPVLDALSYLHSNRFVHGRVKPSNVLAVGDQLKLSSDQAAPVAQQNEQHRRRDVYDAPETAAGIVSPEGDIWSVGVTLVAALTQNVTVAETASPNNRDLPESIPEPFRSIVRECLQLDPNRRGSVREIQGRLRLGAITVPQPPEPRPAAEDSAGSVVESPAEAELESKNRKPLFVAAALLVVVLGILLAVFYPHSNKSAEATEAPKAAATGPTPAAATPAPAKPAETTAKPRVPAGQVVRKVMPDVPRSAQNTIRGTIKVVVRVQVDPSGKVTSATFKTRGSSSYFAKRALNAAQQWEFSAPEAEGQPTASTWLLQFRFKRKSIEATPQRVKG
ncbi:MAG TPA: TonB family protein [Candidatus Sulfotelmatobacter sp.]|nr:TonB family protein [Candidatus Sulfotelmatobacter sp.]